MINVRLLWNRMAIVGFESDESAIAVKHSRGYVIDRVITTSHLKNVALSVSGTPWHRAPVW